MTLLICLSLILLHPIGAHAQDSVFFTPDTVYCNAEYHGVWYLDGVVSLVNSSADTLVAYRLPTDPLTFQAAVAEPQERIDISFHTTIDVNDPNFDVGLFTNQVLIRLERRHSDGTKDSVFRHFVITGAAKAFVSPVMPVQRVQLVLFKNQHPHLRTVDFGESTMFDLSGRIRYLGAFPSEGLALDPYEPGVYLLLDYSRRRKLLILLEP